MVFMKQRLSCPHCPTKQEQTIVCKGSFLRADKLRVQRYLCLGCKRYFSDQTSSIQYRQKKRKLLYAVKKLIVSGVSRRHIARTLKINRKTIERKIKLLANRAEVELSRLVRSRIYTEIEFDEMETFEHTKCKPLSIPLVVSKERLVLAIGLAQMPAKGHLAKISRKKYGPRADHRSAVNRATLSSVQASISPECVITTDEKPSYPSLLREFFKKAVHKTTNGGRGCITGYGELKKKGFDPMFALNHTAAMLRDRLATLRRRTWTTTKKPENLLLLLKIYAASHNRAILNSL